MSLTKEQLIAEVEETYKDLTQDDWLTKIKKRGLFDREDAQLKDLENLYPAKIIKTQEMMFAPVVIEKEDGESSDHYKLRVSQEIDEQAQYCTDKIARMKDKFAAVMKELEYREKEDNLLGEFPNG